MQEIWETLSTRVAHAEDLPTQEETIRLLAQLHNADLLQGEVLPDMDELADRSTRQSRRQMLMRVMNPLAVRIPLFDPDRFLDLTFPIVRPIFSKIGFVLWLGLVVFGMLLAVRHWADFSYDTFAMAFTAQNLLVVALVYPLIKAIHEIGHGYAAKAWGGEVHEIGIMFLVFLPVPYIDASSASAFSQKWRRALVASAGIMTEALLAAIAMILWVLMEPGFARTIAFNVVLIGGVSTLLFNGNPLLRFDGYYVLCDILEIPNMGPRSNKHFFYILRRNFLGVRGEDTPVSARGEAGWFLLYSIAAFVYRLFIVITIALFISTQFFFVGVLLAIFALCQSVLWPIVKGGWYLATHPGLRHHRGRAGALLAGLAAMLIMTLFYVPVPYSTISQGVVQLNKRSYVYALTNGVVTEITSTPGIDVEEGAALFEMKNFVLAGRVDAQIKVLEELEIRKHATEFGDRVQARLLAEQIRHAEVGLEETRRRLEELTIASKTSGRFIVPHAADLIGRFVRKGDKLGYIVSPEDIILRTAIGQDDVDLVRNRTNGISVRRVENVVSTVDARIVREIPMAQVRLPSAALSTYGGGDIVSEADSEGPRAMEGLFNFELKTADVPDLLLVGTRVYIRFDHGTASLAFRVKRAIRQLFLRQFGL